MTAHLKTSVAALALLWLPGQAMADIEAAQKMDRYRVPAFFAQPRGAAGGNGMVYQGGRADDGNGDQRPFRNHSYPHLRIRGADQGVREITGIKVNHQLLGEGEVVQALQTQMQTNRNLYDAYVNDADLVGTHSRLQSAVNLSDWMEGEGADVTSPTLDLEDFIGIASATGPDGKIWQLPDQQFAISIGSGRTGSTVLK